MKCEHDIERIHTKPNGDTYCGVCGEDIEITFNQ